MAVGIFEEIEKKNMESSEIMNAAKGYYTSVIKELMIMYKTRDNKEDEDKLLNMVDENINSLVNVVKMVTKLEG